MLPLLSMNSQSLFVNCVNGNHPLSGKCMLKPRNDKSICIARALYFEPSQCNCHWPIGWYYAVFSVAEHGPTVQPQEFVGGRICGRRSQNAGTEAAAWGGHTHIYIYIIFIKIKTHTFFEWSPPWSTIFWHSFWQTIWKYIYTYIYIWYIYSRILSDILSGIYFDILSDILSGIHSDILFDIYSDILSGILFAIYSDILPGIFSGIHSGIFFGICFDILSDILSGTIWYLFWHSFWNSVWHSIWHSPWRLAEVRQCPLRSGACGWGLAVLTAVCSSRLGRRRRTGCTFDKIYTLTWQAGNKVKKSSIG